MEPLNVTAQALPITTATFQGLGVPLAPEKVEGPSICLNFLSIELDTQAMILWLPQEKLTHLSVLLEAPGRTRRLAGRGNFHPF